LHDDVLKAVKRAGFTTPSPIQEQVIPLILKGRDIVAQAQTGTGKTAAFGLPALSLIAADQGVGLLVITPTRELAQQVGDELYRFGSGRGLRTVIIQGGSSSRNQLELVRKGAQIVVATPGRLLDLLSSHPLPNFKPSVVVLDEADEMLDMGFLEDIQKIFTFLPEERQTLLFSATMPPPIQQLAKKILKKPEFVSATGTDTANRDIEQWYYVIRDEERDQALLRLIQDKEPAKAVIFCRTKKEVDRVAQGLADEGYAAKALHGDLEQSQRIRVVDAFRKGHATLLVATDVAARGLNIVDVSHVFNFHAPKEGESYLHRIGRTARAGRKGEAITLVTPYELRILQRVMKPHGGEMSQGVIATKADLQKKFVAKLVTEIKKQPPAAEARRVLAALQQDMEVEEISLSLISALLVQHKIHGPDQIGMPLQPAQRADRDPPGHKKRPGYAGKPYRKKAGPPHGKYRDRDGDQRHPAAQRKEKTGRFRDPSR
jgi:ATP-dependent RNA helicase DeaD